MSATINSMTLLLLFYCLSAVLTYKDIEIWNRLGGEVWIGAKAEKNYPIPDGGGWSIQKDERIHVTLPDKWKGYFWTRTWCNVGGDNACETGDCAKSFKCRGLVGTQPYTTFEFEVNSAGYDQYAISFVNGFNSMVEIIPKKLEIEDDGDGLCRNISCLTDFYDGCPPELQKRYSIHSIGCQTACQVFKTDQYCCKGEFQEPNCNPETWEKNYPKLYKDACPQAKSYQYDRDDVWHFCRAASYLVILSQPV